MPIPEQSVGVRFAMGAVMASAIASVVFCFVFSFGNVFELGLYLGTPRWIAGLVDPALASTVVGLIVGIRYLAARGLTPDELKPARRLLLFAGAATVFLNFSAALFARGHANQSGSLWWHLGAALYDCIAPALLLGWGHVWTWYLATHNRLCQEDAKVAQVTAQAEREAARAEREAMKQARDTDPPGGTAKPDTVKSARAVPGRDAAAQLKRVAADVPPGGWTAGKLADAAGVSRSTAARFLRTQRADTRADRDRNDDGDRLPDTAPYHPEPVPAEHSNGHHDEDN